MALARITITVPEQLVAAADRRARELERSRSWVVTEALKRYLAAGPIAVHQGASGRRVREPTPPAYAVGEVAEARRRHLLAELAVPPGERLRRAEELGRLGRQAQRRGLREQMIGFESYEDFYEWKRTRLIGG